MSGFRSFRDAHPDVPCLVVARVPERYRVGEILVLPYREFLERFEEWL